MDSVLQSTILFASIFVTFGDVSHFFRPELQFFQPPQQQSHPHVPFLYAPPLPTARPSPSVTSTTEFFLPEIVLNRRVKEPQRGNFIPLNHYLPPPVEDERPPVQQDQIPSLEYLPPKPENPIVVLDDPSGFQGYDYNEPSTTSTSTAKPIDDEPPLQFPSALLPPIPDMSNIGSGSPTTTNPNQGYNYDVPGQSHHDHPSIFQDSVNGNGNVRLHVKEMRCLEHQKGFFRAILKIESFLGTAPIIENDSNDPKCAVKFSRNYLVVNIEAEDFKKCGVTNCGKELCLRLRFPSIRGIRTSFDSLLSLRCKTQTRVAAKTHALKVGISNDIQARNSDVQAHGGLQNEFRTHVELLRKTSNGFNKKLEPNDIVRLGEELLLRAHVGPGDGWNFTKLTDVNLQLISATGDQTRSVNLITSHGCVNPSMRSICPQTPIFEPPLGHRLLFKAVMFQEMRSGQEIVLSMKITGCLDQNDCHIINPEECNGGNFKRQRRFAQENGTNFSEFPRISFRVEMPSGEQDLGKSSDNTEPFVNVEFQRWIILGTLLFIGMLFLLGLFIYCVVKK